MNKLEKLDISNTDINGGVEYLPESLKKVGYSVKERTESKLQLEDSKSYYQAWSIWKNYHQGKKREEITHLDLSNLNLEGNCNLNDFINLKELNCDNNQLNALNLSKCKNLTFLSSND